MTYFKNLSNAVIGEDYMIQNAFSDGDTIEAHTDSLGAGQAKRAVALAGLAAASGGSGKKRRKDPNKPKRPTNAFMHYVDERRPILLDTHCGGPELMKLLGQEWATMTEAEKLPYKQRSAARLNEYREEKVRYNQTFPTAANPPREQTKKLLRRLMQQVIGGRDAPFCAAPNSREGFPRLRCRWAIETRGKCETFWICTMRLETSRKHESG